MRVAISYDVTSNRTRTLIAHILEGYAQRVQKSVFEGELQPRQFQRLRARLAPVPLGPEDSIRYYRLCEVCSERVIIQGAGALVRAPRAFIL